ncbi:restriction endonuclease subunit S [Kaistella yonginensis]|uniref:restriction endonuclease subunit S n=1 Tax=Kaistella yonginensis TaxID=658267 RepID=UPI0025B32778|nr:restriction endonuclease subunit S [Kaistella yonginensis]MDN3605907.1 restriction endonuclease subunit S [Kaistella yonginensis]
MSYKKLGDLVKFISKKNIEGTATILYGINIDKFFMPSVANTIGVDLKKYKVVTKHQFACNRMHVGRDERLPISMSTHDYDFIVSPAYDVFEITSKDVLPEYLMMWFSRKEFDRQCWFYTDADVRGGLSLDALKSIEILIPSIEKQRELVKQYHTISDKIKVNEQICEKLETTAQTLYKHWFVDFEFPNEDGKPYKSSGGEMVFNEELAKEIPEGWEVGDLGNYIESFSKSHTFKKNKLIFFNTSDILNGEFLHSDYMSVADMPGQAKKSIKKDDILYSEIRPNNRRFALVRFEADDYIVSTKLMVLRKTNNVIGLYRLYYYLISDETIKDFQDSAEGRSGTFPQITFEEDLKYRKFLKANDLVESQIEKIFSVTYRKVYNLKDQNVKLTQFRNLLLSRLGRKWVLNTKTKTENFKN